MLKHPIVTSLLLSSLMLGPLVGCSNLPGSPKAQGTVAGGAGGAAAGAIISHRHPLIGALIGGALGAGGGYLVGAHVEKTRDPNRYPDEAGAGAARAQDPPASASAVEPESPSATPHPNKERDGYP